MEPITKRNLLIGNDRSIPRRRDFGIVKTNGLTQKDREPWFCTGPLSDATASDDRHGSVRRRVTAEAGRGLEKLGHALEYLTDEFVRDGCRFAEDHGRIQAIELLASLNRQIYFACGVEPSFRERVQSLVRRLLQKPNLRN